MTAITTYADQVAAEEAIRQLAPEARELTAIEAALGSEDHSVFLNEDAGLVYWAYQEPGEHEWTLDVLPAARAADLLDGALDSVRERLDNPEDYAHYRLIQPEEDFAALDELHDVQLVAVELVAVEEDDHTLQAADTTGWDPVVVVDAELCRRIEAASQQVGRIAALRAYYLRRQLTGERGDQAALARRLGIRPSALSEVLGRDAARRDRIRETAARARAGELD